MVTSTYMFQGQEPTLEVVLSPLMLPKSGTIMPTAIRGSPSLDSFNQTSLRSL